MVQSNSFLKEAGKRPLRRFRSSFHASWSRAAVLPVLALVLVVFSQGRAGADPAAPDEAFQIGGGGEDGNVYSIDYRHDSDPETARILLGGSFLRFGNESRRFLAVLDGTGALVPSEEFSPASIQGPPFPPSQVEVAKWDSQGRIVIGGQFNEVGGQSRGSVARLNANGSLDTSFNPPAANGRVRDLVILDDDSVIIVGDFTQVGGETVGRIARLNANGSRDTSFGGSGGFNGAVHTVTLTGDGDLVVGGDFTSYRSSSAGRLVRIDSASGDRVDGFSVGNGFAGGPVRTVHVTAAGDILAGGEFSFFDGNPANRLVRLGANGARLSLSIGTGFNNPVLGVSSDAENRILVVGAFTQVNNEPRSRVVRLLENGSLDPTFDPADGTDSQIGEVWVQEDGKILIGGNFRFYRGQNHRRLARLMGGGEVAEPGDGFDAWRQEVFAGGDASNDAVSGPQADPDGDGVANLLEYAFDGDPLTAYSARLPEQGVAQEGGDAFLEITFHRINADDLVYRVQATSNLNDAESWTEIWVSTNHPFSGETITVRDTTPIQTGASRFLRVQVVLE